jgi:hypothetical protein
MPRMEKMKGDRRIRFLPIAMGFLFASGCFLPGNSWSEDVITLGSIRIDKVKKEIRVQTRVALAQGILEYLLVCDEGKTYESALKLGGTKPSELNFALLLIGCEPLDFPTFMKLKEDKDGGITTLLKDYKKSVVEIELWKDEKKVALETLIRNREGSNEALWWVYTGGFFFDSRRFSADIEFSLIGFVPDETALIALFSKAGNPYRGAFGFEMNKENKALEVNQPYEIILRRKAL